MKWILVFCLLTVSFYINAQESDSERKMGADQYELIKNTQGFYHQETILNLVSRVGKRLEKQLEDSSYAFNYFIIDTTVPNAFATSGGYVYVTRGLLALVESEDELACAMAHEISHVTLHHTKKRVRRNILPAVVEIPGKLIGQLWVEEVGEIINFPVEFLSKTVNSSFDRKQEKQADESGIALAMKAGYNPNALKTMLQKLQKEVDLLTGHQAKRSIFNDHPMTEDRLSWIDQQVNAAVLQWDAPQSVVRELDGLLLGQNPAQGMLTKNNIFVHPDLNILMQLPSEWAVENIPVALTAKANNDEAVLIVGIEQQHNSLDEAAQVYIDEVDKQKKVMLKEMDSIPINIYKSREVVTVQKKGKQEILSFLVWAQLPDSRQILQIAGSTISEEGLNNILTAVSTLRPLSVEERNAIYEQVIRISNGKNESLAEFASRTDNADYLPMLEIMNDIGKDQNVNNKELKYVEEVPYQQE